MDVGDGYPPWGDCKLESEVKSRWMSVMETRSWGPGRRFSEGLWRLDDDTRSWSHRRHLSDGLWRLEDEDEEEGELAFA